jgi:ABC-type phosphate transport system permease subunit
MILLLIIVVVLLINAILSFRKESSKWKKKWNKRNWKKS